ncbi:MAG: hypothetical protein AB3N18_13350 [Allomuricauda sp.]
MKQFLFTIRQTINAFKRPHAGGTNKLEEDVSLSKIQALARIGITLLLIFVVLYLFKADTTGNNYSKIASTIMGAIVGYWFR